MMSFSLLFSALLASANIVRMEIVHYPSDKCSEPSVQWFSRLCAIGVRSFFFVI